MKAIIADDESLLRDELKRLLSKLWPELEIIDLYENGTDALAGITAHTPDIAFLDIQMPGMDGLEVASNAPEITYIVFITSFDHYAVEAFEKNAIDYLLKPIDEERLSKTIDKLEKQLSSHNNYGLGNKISEIRSDIQQQKQEPLKWIKALKGELVHMIHIDDILFFNADQKYTSAHTTDGEFIIRTPITRLEEMLDNNIFWRIHRGTIVNVNYIKNARRTRDGRYILKLKNSDDMLDVSRSYAHLFKQL